MRVKLNFVEVVSSRAFLASSSGKGVYESIIPSTLNGVVLGGEKYKIKVRPLGMEGPMVRVSSILEMLVT